MARIPAVLLFGAAATMADGAINFLSSDFSTVQEEVQSALLAVLSGGAGSAKLAVFEEELRPTYLSLPKNENGQLDGPTVRYALHRYFVQKHGWYVKGLEPLGDHWNASSSANITQDRLPHHVQALLDQELHNHGMDLSELAAFAATFTDIINQHVVHQMHSLYDVLQVPMDALLDGENVDKALRHYIAFLLDDGKRALESSDQLVGAEIFLRENFPGWDALTWWVSDLRQTFEFSESSRRNHFGRAQMGFSFEDVAAIALQMVEQVGTATKFECSALKDKLVALDKHNIGRVALSDFYASSAFDFHESMAYLRNLGALDETDERFPSIVIPSYIVSSSNCISHQTFFSVCCPDECEGLLGRLEEKIAAPIADPARVAEIVSGLSSDSVVAPRNLSAPLLRRLDDIAVTHDGHVPLHGRLFMQWMHHAFPRECAFPHEAGSHKPVTQHEWIALQDVDDVMVSDEERHAHVTRRRSPLDEIPAPEEPLPWSAVEELVATHKPQSKHQAATPTSQKSIFEGLRLIAAAVALASLVVSLLRVTKELAAPAEKDEKVHSI